MNACCDKMAKAQDSDSQTGFLEPLPPNEYDPAHVVVRDNHVEVVVDSSSGVDSGVTVIQFCPWCGAKVGK